MGVGKVVLNIGTKTVDNSKLKHTKRGLTMAVGQFESENLGVLMIDFSTVVRDCLQTILTRTGNDKLRGTAETIRNTIQMNRSCVSEVRSNN